MVRRKNINDSDIQTIEGAETEPTDNPQTTCKTIISNYF